MRFIAEALTAMILLSPRAGAADKAAVELVAAVQAGDTKKVESLIAEGAKVNARGKGGTTPLLAAVAKGNATIVKLLTDRGARVDARDERAGTPLFVAAREGYDSVVLALLTAGA